jgi:hypothetical protein
LITDPEVMVVPLVIVTPFTEGNTEINVAETACTEFMVTEHEPEPTQAPDQPEKA